MGKHVGNYIRQLREKRGLSQGDVARLLSLKTAQSISNIERGVSPLPRTKIKRLADILGIRKSELVTVVLDEVHDRYTKLTGLNARPFVVSSDLSHEERDLLQLLAEKLRTTKSGQRTTIRRKMERLLKH